MAERERLRHRLDDGLAAMGLDLPGDVRERLVDYVELLTRWNAAYNLTAVRDPGVMIARHLLDSLPGLRWKAWLLSEALPARPQPKSYAPLYLFDQPQDVHAFLCGDLYRAVTDSFGWTQPHHGHATGRPGPALVLIAAQDEQRSGAVPSQGSDLSYTVRRTAAGSWRCCGCACTR